MSDQDAVHGADAGPASANTSAEAGAGPHGAAAAAAADGGTKAAAAGAGSKPSRRDRLRPAELIGFSAILAIFTGLIVIMATREPLLAVIAFGVAFIIGLVGLAMFSLAFQTEEQSPDGEYKTRLR